MVPIKSDYISRAWESELRYHERNIAELRIKMEKLAKDLAWELQKHHSRVQELHRLEAPLSKEAILSPAKTPNRERTHKTFVQSDDKGCDIQPFVEPTLIRMKGRSAKKDPQISKRLELPV